MEWFRFYHEVVDDPKVQRLSPILFKHWVNILCLSSRNSDRGCVPSAPDLSFGLRLSESKVRSICAELIAVGLIDRDTENPVRLRVHAWTSRQKRSDDVTARVNKHRYGNDDVTPNETLHETLHATDDETFPRVRVKNRTEENRTEESTPPPPRGETYSQEFQEFWKAYPKKKSKDEAWRAWKSRRDRPPLMEIVASIERQKLTDDWIKDNGRFIPHPATWLRGGDWKDDDQPLTANGRMDWATATSEQIEAWRQVEQAKMLRQL